MGALWKMCIWHVSLRSLRQTHHRILELRNHRTTEWWKGPITDVGRDLWSTSSPTPIKAGSYTAGCRITSRQVSSISRERLYNLSVQPVLMLCHPHRKEAFSSYADGTSCVSFCANLCPPGLPGPSLQSKGHLQTQDSQQQTHFKINAPFIYSWSSLIV